MKNIIFILFVFISTGVVAQNTTGKQYIPWLKSDAITIPGPADDATQKGYFIWHGDTIDFSMLTDSTIVYEQDSTVLFVTLKQLIDSLNSLPGGHSPVTIGANGTTAGLTVTGQELNMQSATAARNGYLTSLDFSNFYNKLSSVAHNYTLTGSGTSIDPLKADTVFMAAKIWVLAQNYINENQLHWDSITNKPTIPTIEHNAFDGTWDGDLDGTDKNTIYDVISALPGGHDAVTLSGSALLGGLSLSGQEISFQPATTSQSGYLPSKDWTRFNKDTSATNELDNIQSVLDYGNKYYKTTTLSSDSTFAARYSITQTNGSSTNKFYNSKFYTTYSGSQNQSTFGGIANFVNNAGTGTVTSLGGFPLTINTSSTSNTTNIYSYPVSIFQRGRFNKMSGHSSWIYNYGRNAANNDAYGSVSTLYNYGFFDGYAGFQVDAYNYASMNDMDGLQIGLYTSTDSLNTMTGITMGYLSHAWTGSPKHSKGIYINRSIDRGTLSQHSILSESRALSRLYGKLQLDTLRGTGNRFAMVDANGIFSATKKDSITYWNDAYAKRIATFTTTGSSGAATFIGNTLNIPNYTLTGLGGVPTSRTITINGTTYDLSANRTWTVSGGSGNLPKIYEGLVTDRNIDLTILDYTPADNDIIKLVSDDDIADGDSITVSINGGTAYPVFEYNQHDNDYALELMFLNDTWFVVTKFGEEASLKGTVDATNLIVDTNGIRYVGLGEDRFTDSTLVPMWWVLQQFAVNNNKTQTLVGTTPYWNITNGKNAEITLTGTTTITFSNLTDGDEGTLYVTNGGSTSYRITFAGYNVEIYPSVWYTGDEVSVSGSTKKDVFTYKYIGGTINKVVINGALDLK